MAKFKALVFILFALALVYPMDMLAPTHAQVQNGDIVYLGEIGPGQTIAMSFDGRPIIGGLMGHGGAYDYASASGLNQGWTTKPSDVMGNPLQVTVTAAKNATPGTYSMNVEVQDEGDLEKLGNISFTAKVKVTYDVLDVSLDRNETTVLAGQPARFYITIYNKASTPDAFLVSSSGVPGWKYEKQVFVPARSSKTIVYELISNEEESYFPTISIVSQSSNLISANLTAKVNVRSDIITDYKATNNGMLFFPVMNGIIYSLAGLISNLF